MTRSLLVATDLSARSVPPLERALALAARSPGARVALVHVLTDAGHPSLAAEAARDAARAMERLARDCARPGAPVPEILARSGDPGTEIPALARERAADLILAGPARPRRFAEALYDTTVERLVGAGAAPVLVVRKAGAPPWRQAIVAADLSETSERALKVARALSLFDGARVDLVHAYRPQVPQTAGFGDADGTGIARAVAAERAALARDLEAFLAAAGAGPLRARPVLVEGPAAEAILAHAAATRAGLIVAGTRGRSGLVARILGSTARALIRQAACDVLAVPPAPA